MFNVNASTLLSLKNTEKSFFSFRKKSPVFSTVQHPTNNMERRIPTDFGTKFPMSDIVISTLNSDGKELHASKMLLATHSPYFEAMFFGQDWKEKSAEALNMDEDYNVVLGVLRIIYNIRMPSIKPKPHPPSELQDLYRFADKYDIPMIRELCKQELEAQVTSDSLLVTAELGLHDIKSKLFSKMDPVSMKKFVDTVGTGDDLLFTKTDLISIGNKLTACALKKYKAMKFVVRCTVCETKIISNVPVRFCVYCKPRVSFRGKCIYESENLQKISHEDL